MADYTVEGKITIDVSVEVHADSEKAALMLAENALKERYRLDFRGSYHNSETGFSFDLTAFDDSDYQD